MNRSLLLLALSTLVASTAAAQTIPDDEGFDGTGYVHIPSDGDVDDAINLWRPERQQAGSWGFEGLFQYASAPVVLVNSATDERIGLLTKAAGLNIGGHVAVHERVAIGLSVPLWLSTQQNGNSSGPTLGDTRISAPIGVLLRDEASSAGFNLSVVPTLRLPTGSTARLLGNNGVGGEFTLAPSWSTDAFEIAGNIGAGFGKTESYANLNPGNNLILGLSAGWHLDDVIGIRGELWTHPALKSSEVSGRGTPGEMGLNARVRIVDPLTATVGFQSAFTRGAGASPARLFIGLVAHSPKGPNDTDADGIVDRLDQCVNDPETVNNYKDDDGCPDALGTVLVTVVDPDGNGIGDMDIELNGSVVGRTNSRGQFTMHDQMPGSTANLASIDPRGVTTSTTAAVEVAEGENTATIEQTWRPGSIRVIALDEAGSPVNANIAWAGPGEPGARDLGDDGDEFLFLGPGDWDLIARADGFRPEEREVTLQPAETSLEVINLSVVPARTVVTQSSIVILEAIHFAVDSAQISEESLPIVQEVATNIRITPEIGGLEVQGHTDSQGSRAYNRDLSQRRVDSVLEALVQRGVARDRLSATGFGEDCPVADNGNAEGRAQNRRVQFFITDPAPEGGLPCHDGNPAQNTMETIQIERQVEE